MSKILDCSVQLCLSNISTATGYWSWNHCDDHGTTNHNPETTKINLKQIFFIIFILYAFGLGFFGSYSNFRANFTLLLQMLHVNIGINLNVCMN